MEPQDEVTELAGNAVKDENTRSTDLGSATLRNTINDSSTIVTEVL